MSDRGLVPGLDTPHPMERFLPALYLEYDDFALRLTASLDSVLAPIISCLDNLDSYLDPLLTPEDFLAWLSTWVGIDLDENWPVELRRRLVARAVDLHRLRGTRRGLAEQVRILTQGEVEIEENGATAWSPRGGGPLPGSPTFDLLVRVRVDEPKSIHLGHLEALVAAYKPAHVAHRIEVVARTGGNKR